MSNVGLGPLLFEDCRRVVFDIDGEESIVFERGEDGQCLLSVDIYDLERNHVAKLRRNAFVFNNGDYAVKTDPAKLSLSPNGELDPEFEGYTFLTAGVIDRDTMWATGQAYTKLGRSISIDDGYVMINAERSVVPEPRTQSISLIDGFRFVGAPDATIRAWADNVDLDPGAEGTVQSWTERRPEV
jgi:hypothetical protein